MRRGSEPPVGSYEWCVAHREALAGMGYAVPALPPLRSWAELDRLGWVLERGGWWSPPGWREQVRGRRHAG